MLPAGPRGDASTLSAESRAHATSATATAAFLREPEASVVQEEDRRDESQEPRSCKRRTGATSATAIAPLRREPEAWRVEPLPSELARRFVDASERP